MGQKFDSVILFPNQLWCFGKPANKWGHFGTHLYAVMAVLLLLGLFSGISINLLFEKSKNLLLHY